MESYGALRHGEGRLRRRRLLLTLALLAAVGLPLAFYAARRFERSVVFQPAPYDGGPSWRLPRRGEDVWFETNGGARLHGWFVRAQTPEPAATVLYLHGNGGNLSYTGWLGEELSARGFDVLLFDYRGYGRSGGASVDERTLYEDADAAYYYLTRERGVSPARLVLYGQSLGTTAAVDLAARRECAALILESGLSSAAEMAAVVWPGLPRSLARLGHNRLDSAGKLGRVSAPVLVAHGERDEVIPLAQGRALYEAAREPKRQIVVPGAGHNDLVAKGGRAYLDALAEFIHEATRSSTNK